MTIEDSVGKSFGRLTILKSTTKGNCLCRCVCGNEKEILFYRIKIGVSKSCGCLRKEVTSRRSKKHGGSGTKLHGVWFGIKTRCYNKNSEGYKFYGLKGVGVCNEWKDDFSKFRDWALENGYREGLTIDRINPNKNYEPENCRWITNQEQAANKRDSLFVNYKGETLCLTDMCKKHGLNHVNVRQYRNKYKITPLEAFIDFMLRGELGMEGLGRPTQDQLLNLMFAKDRWLKENGKDDFE